MENMSILTGNLLPGEEYDMKSYGNVAPLEVFLVTVNKETEDYTHFSSQRQGRTRLQSEVSEENVIREISEEMCRADDGDFRELRFPRFCPGALHHYFSYALSASHSVKEEHLYRLFRFIHCYFSALCIHLLRVKLLSKENQFLFLEAAEEMVGLAKVIKRKMNQDASKTEFFVNVSMIRSAKTRVFAALRPLELSFTQFNYMWKRLVRSCLYELIFVGLVEKPKLKVLCMISPIASAEISRHEDCFKAFFEEKGIEVRPEQSGERMGYLW